MLRARWRAIGIAQEGRPLREMYGMMGDCGHLPLYEARMGRHFAAMDGEVSEQALGKKAAFWRRLLIDLSIMTVIGVFLAVIGPFGSIQMPLAVRLLSLIHI